MTLRRYLDSDDLKMNTAVIACEPIEEGRYHVLLEATLFHPQGGGQPADIGTIGDAQVLNVFQDESGIVHITDRPVNRGMAAIAVEAENRQTNTRMHSAGHLIGYVGEQAGWKAIKANHRPGEGRVVFDAADNGTPLTVTDFNAQVNRLVNSKLLRHQYMEGETRKVTWGDLPPYACGGTHVASTEETGTVEITAVKLKKGALSVSYTLS
ncbi:alanyl-tRNA editing protein [Pantoea sp. LMR881]|uniref:alanyl-tRNA editing protein n=1 Tax=Pantoea sp. LMR881 TaxID=3014336 RepID=UPI0022AFB6F4|nr:alanyl-tRNA editing protein [Pantoea sp. LMR881]MCZ4057903.1 alanyl-tRNA editing protein [Pantoea sp. LMR881]